MNPRVWLDSVTIPPKHKAQERIGKRNLKVFIKINKLTKLTG
ncbi:hypothetical protein CP09DC77_0217 [Chlamydia psittaci 09DC77]|nr:hypothetical protein CP09DC77_0217 [Chlamydia psittaci 09DC77]